MTASVRSFWVVFGGIWLVAGLLVFVIAAGLTLSGRTSGAIRFDRERPGESVWVGKA